MKVYALYALLWIRNDMRNVKRGEQGDSVLGLNQMHKEKLKKR